MELSPMAIEEMENMDNDQISELVAEICYVSKGDAENLKHIGPEHLMAVQLLMEKVVLTDDDDSYTQETMAGRISEYIGYMDDHASMFDDGDVPEDDEIEDVVMSKE